MTDRLIRLRATYVGIAGIAFLAAVLVPVLAPQGGSPERVLAATIAHVAVYVSLAFTLGAIACRLTQEVLDRKDSPLR